jgi:hypothetical protein
MGFKYFYEENTNDDSLFLTKEEFESMEVDEYLQEKLIKTWVVRNGKRVLKFKTDREGYKVVKDGSIFKEIRMTPQELMNRKKAQRKASLKRKSKSSVSQTKRLKSFKQRDRMNLKNIGEK